jgi:DNA sulfur modification protein DndD
MKIKFAGWRSKNLRGYLNDFEFDLGASEAKYTLFQMPNGLGKTTTLDLFQIALTGSGLSRDEVHGLRANDLVEDGYFEIQLLYDDQPLAIRIEFDFRARTSVFKNTFAEQKTGGEREGFSLPDELHRTFQKGIVDLFVFNGELASNILKSDKGAADKAIYALHRLNHISKLKLDVDELAVRRQRQADGTKAETKNSIDRFKRELAEAEQTLSDLNAKRNYLNKSIEEKTKLADHCQLEMDKHTTDSQSISDEIGASRINIAEATQQLKSLTTNALGAYRLPTKIHTQIAANLEHMVNTLEKKKLPRTSSSEFFEDLAKGEECVCDTPITAKERMAIEANAKNYLCSDEIAILNHLKLIRRNESGGEVTFYDAAIALDECGSELRKLRQNLERLQRKASKLGTEDYNKLKLERDDAKGEQKRLAVELNRIERADPSDSSSTWSNNIPKCTKHRNELKRKLETASGTFEFMSKVKVLNNLIEKVLSLSLSKLRVNVQNRTNTILERIMQSEPIRVLSIDGRLKIGSEKHTEKANASEGQKLVVSYAFLAALLSDAPHQLPLVVDSPAAPLDVRHRRTVAKLIPELFDQMLMFVTSGEREGFSDSLYEHPNARFVTLSIPQGEEVPIIEEGLPAFMKFDQKEDPRV